VGCFIALFALISPRLALFFVWIFSDLLSRAFEDWWVPFLGFFILPWTTLVYAVCWSTGTHGVHGFEVFFVAFAFVVDVASYLGGRRERERR
jgi:hypothetical protein